MRCCWLFEEECSGEKMGIRQSDRYIPCSLSSCFRHKNLSMPAKMVGVQHTNKWARKYERILYAFFWVIPRRLEFICRRFGTLRLFHLHRQVDVILLTSTCLWRWNRQSVPKRPHINSRRQGITQKKAYNLQNTTKAWNQEWTYLSQSVDIKLPNLRCNNANC